MAGEPTEYACEGCGVLIVRYGRRPSHGLCVVCEFLCEHEPPERLMQMRRRCEPGGWISERQRREAGDGG